MSSDLLIVESPSKAKTLKKYLGGKFDVLASYGHVRDLIPKTGAVDPDNDFSMKYELIDRNSKHVDAIAKAVKNAKRVFLATDPDREGEAIAWHLAEILKQKKLLKEKELKRVVFYEITQSAVKEAIAHPRDIAMDLVNAQQARRALDYLVGFNLSPLLWKKISRGLSAGRVQSPALRLIVEREQEIEKFESQEYWSIHFDSHKGKQKFSAKLFQYQGDKLTQFSVTSQDGQQDIIGNLIVAAKGEGKVVSVERKRKQRQPAAPFTTSTLQQEAVRKLGFTTERAMRTAQQLYEGIDIGSGTVGLITYMRTDSVNLANEAIDEIRKYVGDHFDADYLPKGPVIYKSKSKNAQEAHEAVRPTSIFRTPESLKDFLSAEQAKLYEMIWKRSLACQMSPAKFDTLAVDVAVGGPKNLFRATGQTLVFPGFIAVYQEGEDDAENDGEESKLPQLEEGEVVPLDKLYGEQHFTQPPPRYSEASLVKALEEYGIGRPSTYASIISTLLNREYAILDKKRFVPTEMGRMVNGFLTEHFTRYVDYNFTAQLEDQLDEISTGKKEWVPVLSHFWTSFKSLLDNKQDVERGTPLGEKCPQCGKELYKYPSKRGFFIGCSGYPACDYTRPLESASPTGGPIVLGTQPETGLEVLLQKGPYGFYVQLGPTVPDSKVKPKRVAWPRNIPPEAATLEQGLQLLSLPRKIGTHPETGKEIEANIGRFGPYLKHDGAFKSIPKSDSVFTVDLDRSIELLAEKKSLRGAIKDLGPHPDDQASVGVFSGRYGPYVKHGKVMATIPAKINPDNISMPEALELLAAKSAKGATTVKKASKTTAKKPAKAKTPTKAKAPAKATAKATPKKTATKKKAA